MPEDYDSYTPQVPQHGGAFHETASPVNYVERPAIPRNVFNNLYPTLTGNSTDGYKLAMTLGHVDARKHVGDAALPISITNIPGQPDPIADALTVASGDKIFCEITENHLGVATAAEIKKASTWPTSTAADLLGGDDQTGTAGTRNVRLCEIITDSGLVKVKTYHSGNIAHFQSELVENLTTSPGTGEARVYKQWNAAAGRHDLRFLKAICGIKIEEKTDHIEVKPDGNTFKVRLWKPTLSVNVFTYQVIVTQPASPEKEFWVLNGVWYTSLPSNWDTCGGSGVPTYNFSYLAPVGGGS
jgi:hypothetical protein